MEHGEVVFTFLFPSDEQPAEAVEPAVGALDHPAAGLDAVFALGGGLLAAASDVGGKTQLVKEDAHGVGIVGLVHAHPLGPILGGIGPFDGNAGEGRLDQGHIVPVGAGDGNAEGQAGGLGHQAAVDTLLVSIGWISTGFFPPPRAP